MKEFEDLNPIEKAVLLACCRANKLSKTAHNAIGLIVKKIEKINEKNKTKYINRGMKSLIANGFVYKHPTRGGITYQLTKKGVIACNKLIFSFKKT